MEDEITGPEDEFDPETNGDPDSLTGEEDEAGFDEMSPEVGWEDEEGEDDDDLAEEPDDC